MGDEAKEGIKNKNSIEIEKIQLNQNKSQYITNH